MDDIKYHRKNTIPENEKTKRYEKTFFIKKIVKTGEPELKIKSIDFSIFSEEDIKRLSVVEISNPDIYNNTPKRSINENGPLDLKLGTSLKANLCKTCGKNLADCLGHFGHINLPLPVYHVGFFKETLRIYQSICKTCSRLLLTPKQKIYFQYKMIEAKKLGKMKTREISKELSSQVCAKVKLCYYCGAANGVSIKASKFYGILHKKFNNNKTLEEKNHFITEFYEAIKRNSDIKKHIESTLDFPNPLTVYKLFRQIRAEDLFILNISFNRPEDLLITSLVVPPSSIRPTVTIDDSKTQEDDLTIKLRSIVVISNLIKSLMEKGKTTPLIREHWILLQTEVARYINSDMPGFSKNGPIEKQIRSLTQRLKGKGGRFRGNLSGKRVDFSGRTVISPDPNVEIDQVVIPKDIAIILTFPDTVNEHNIDHLKENVKNGPNKYPGANFVLHKMTNIKQFLKYGDRNEVAKNLRLGDIVERHLQKNDVVLFNRQPSLHRISIMAHKAVVMDWKTLRFNLCVCNPYNADFDGDEMNIHVPQTQEARAEASELMLVHNNFVTPKCGEPLIVPLQDFLTAGYLITNKNIFYDRSSFMQICCHFSKEKVIMPSPAILKPIRLWTGKQIIDIMLRPNNDPKWPLINLESPTKQYPKKANDANYPRGCLDPYDRYVIISKGRHISGNFDKKILGSSKTGLFYNLINFWGPKITAEIMGRLSKLCSRWLGEYGFSIGIDDVTPSTELSAAKSKLMDQGYADCAAYEKLYKSGSLKPQPGCTTLETLEAKMLGKLSDIREISGQRCIESLSYFTNSPIIMATCGSKGSTINIAQMIACVGQQALQSGRIPEGFVNRTLPHFNKNSRSPEAKGFVRNSFFTGLNATEFFFHTMAGREGLVDTAVKTADTGYMQRRLMKALEDGCVQYDNTVRNCENVVLQFAYGEDGLDPISSGKMDGKKFYALLQHVRSKYKTERKSLLPNQISINTQRILTQVLPQENFGIFEKEIINFIQNEIINPLKSTRKKLNLKIKTHSKNEILEKFCLDTVGITMEQLNYFIKESRRKNEISTVEPGTAVGAIGAQSIGEPSTQMTLKTFHFAGVASMNITLGVPRIKEIINAVKNIKTPIINAALDCIDNEQVARIVKGRLEITKLGGVCKYIKQIVCNDTAFIEICINKDTVNNLMLDIDTNSIKESILRNKKLKLKESNIDILNNLIIRIISSDIKRNTLSFSLERLALLLPDVQIEGIENIHRAVIRHPDPIKYRWEYQNLKNKNARWKCVSAQESLRLERAYSKKEYTSIIIQGEKLETNFKLLRENIFETINIKSSNNNNFDDFLIRRCKIEYELTVEGIDFMRAMTTSGVDGLNTTTNLIPEVEAILGIEAAREAIVNELMFTFSVHGLTVDMRHIMLLADVMTFKGNVLGITRFGIAKMKDSVLMQASFETPMEHLFYAALEGEKDPVKGVSECIILGTPMPIGSGTFQLLRKVEPFEFKEEKNLFE